MQLRQRLRQSKHAMCCVQILQCAVVIQKNKNVIEALYHWILHHPQVVQSPIANFLFMSILWQAVVLIPKGKGKYQGICLVEVIWKVLAAILNLRITASITYHNLIHGLQACRVTGTATLEAELLHQLAGLEVGVHVCDLYGPAQGV